MFVERRVASCRGVGSNIPTPVSNTRTVACQPDPALGHRRPEGRRKNRYTTRFSSLPEQGFRKFPQSGGRNNPSERRTHADHTHARTPQTDARRTTSGTFSSSSRAFHASTRPQAPTPIPSATSTSRGYSARSARATSCSAPRSACGRRCALRTNPCPRLRLRPRAQKRRRVQAQVPLIASRDGGTTISEEGRIWTWTWTWTWTGTWRGRPPPRVGSQRGRSGRRSRCGPCMICARIGPQVVLVVEVGPSLVSEEVATETEGDSEAFTPRPTKPRLAPYPVPGCAAHPCVREGIARAAAGHHGGW